MHGFIANTDFDWFRYLRQAQPDEANFWQPGGGRPLNTVAPGEPILFRLKKPHYAIAGYGHTAGWRGIARVLRGRSGPPRSVVSWSGRPCSSRGSCG